MSINGVENLEKVLERLGDDRALHDRSGARHGRQNTSRVRLLGRREGDFEGAKSRRWPAGLRASRIDDRGWPPGRLLCLRGDPGIIADET